jgi:hypothetical protein
MAKLKVGITFTARISRRIVLQPLTYIKLHIWSDRSLTCRSSQNITRKPSVSSYPTKESAASEGHQIGHSTRLQMEKPLSLSDDGESEFGSFFLVKARSSVQDHFGLFVKARST